MISNERAMQLMKQVGMPESRSLLQALRQCDMEARADERNKISKLVSELLSKIKNYGE